MRCCNLEMNVLLSPTSSIGMGLFVENGKSDNVNNRLRRGRSAGLICRVRIAGFTGVYNLLFAAVSAAMMFISAGDVQGEQHKPYTGIKPSTYSDNCFVVSNKIVRVGLYPLDGYHNYKDGIPVSGYGYDYLQHLRRYAPWIYEYSGIKYDWPDVFGMLENGELDLVSNIRKTPERELKFAFSKFPMGQSSTILTVREGNTHYDQGVYTNWNGIRIGMIRGNSWEDKFAEFARQRNFTCKFVQFENTEELLAALQNGTEIDAALTHNLRRLQNEWILEQLDSEQFYIAVRKGDKELISELDYAMGQLDLNFTALRDSLWDRYFAEAEAEDIIYSEDEQNFIKKANEHGHVFVGVLNPDRYPISSWNGSGYTGIVKDFADEVIRKSGLKIRFYPTRNADEYKRACENPNVDIIFDVPADLHEAECRGLILSKPYITLTASMLYNNHSGDRIRRAAIVKRYRITDEIMKYFPADVSVVMCDSSAEAVRLVASGECDAACLHTYAAESAVRNDPHDRLVSTLVPSLANCKLNGTLQAIDEKTSCAVFPFSCSVSFNIGTFNKTFDLQFL